MVIDGLEYDNRLSYLEMLAHKHNLPLFEVLFIAAMIWPRNDVFGLYSELKDVLDLPNWHDLIKKGTTPN